MQLVPVYLAIMILVLLSANNAPLLVRNALGHYPLALFALLTVVDN